MISSCAIFPRSRRKRYRRSSQTIRHLESRLGVQLLNRTTRSVAPTRAVARLHERVAPRLTPDVKMLALASPDYLSRCGEPKTPADLHRHACINWRFPGSGRIYRWQFEKRRKKLEMAVEGPLISNHQDVVIEGALQDLGILYAYDDDRVDEAVAGGRLKRVLADWSLTSPGLYLYYSQRRHPQPALRAFIDCLLDRDKASSGRRANSGGA